MELNLKINKTVSVKLSGHNYPISVSGDGFPSLAIGIGTLMQRTFSQKFKTSFKVFSSDLYWIKNNEFEEPPTLSMPQIIDDIEELRQHLGLTSYILIGHSAYGIVALEYAKKYGSTLKGIVMIGTPLNSNPEVAACNNKYFETYAEPLRKQIDFERRTLFANEDLSHLDPAARFLRTYIWRDAPRYWHDPIFDCTPLWSNIHLNGPLLDHFFEAILPNTDVTIGLEKVQCPVFLAAGMSDYDCCPWMWSQINNFSKLTVSLFNKSGHYPNYEESELFDTRVKLWANSL